MVILFSHKLISSALFYMKAASWGCCVLVFNSCRELGVRPEQKTCVVSCSSETEFVIVCNASDEEVFSATPGAHM